MVLLLRNLVVGERFIHASVKDVRKAIKYKVVGKCEYNRFHGSSTRICLNENVMLEESKSCNLQVVKLPVK